MNFAEQYLDTHFFPQNHCVRHIHRHALKCLKTSNTWPWHHSMDDITVMLPVHCITVTQLTQNSTVHKQKFLHEETLKSLMDRTAVTDMLTISHH